MQLSWLKALAVPFKSGIFIKRIIYNKIIVFILNGKVFYVLYSNLFYAKSSLYHCRNFGYRMATWLFCIQCFRFNPHFVGISNYSDYIGPNKKSLISS